MRRSVLSLGRLLPVLALVALAAVPAVSQGIARGSDRPHGLPALDGAEPGTTETIDALAADAAEIAGILGISAEEMQRYLELQPLVGELQARLAAEDGFGGLYLEYEPYRIVTLVTAEDLDVRAALEGTQLAELEPFIETRFVDVAEADLERALTTIDASSSVELVQGEVDIRSGTVTVWVRTPEDAERLRSWIDAAEASGPLAIPSDRIVIRLGAGVTLDADSYGGLNLNKQVDGSPECTSGFSVEETSGGRRNGVTTAGHRANALEFSNGDDIVFQAERMGGNQEAQRHTTPGRTDRPWVKDGTDSHRIVKSRTARAEQVIGAGVCKYGRTTGYTCGIIESKSFDPGEGFEATFIRVDNGDSGDLSGPGDSGCPWFSGNSAYGTHVGAPTDDPNDAVYMAQNYLGYFGIRVKVA